MGRCYILTKLITISTRIRINISNIRLVRFRITVHLHRISGRDLASGFRVVLEGWVVVSGLNNISINIHALVWMSITLVLDLVEV